MYEGTWTSHPDGVLRCNVEVWTHYIYQNNPVLGIKSKTENNKK